MSRLYFRKCEEVLIEDLDQCDVHESFTVFEDDCVFVIDDEDNEITLDCEEMECEEGEVIDIPEGYYGHGTVWRGSEFSIELVDPTHKITSSDFTFKWVTVGEYEYRVISLKEEIGTLEFDSSFDGICDEVLDIEGRPGPEEDW